MEALDPAKVARARRRITDGPELIDLNHLREVVCEPSRLRIVEALGDDELSVGDLSLAIDRKVPATSQHLRVLRELGVVQTRRRARTVYYRIRPGSTFDQVRTILEYLRSGRNGASSEAS